MIFRDYEKLTQFINANLDTETRNFEYKKGLPWDGEFRQCIVKGIIAMSNIRDGGSIIIGVEENENTFEPVGITKENADTYVSDDVMQFTNEKYADPYVQIRLQHFSNSDKRFINIHIEEFEDIPVICKNNYEDVLQKGRLYSRSYSKPQSTSDLTSSELREIIELAVDKKLNKKQQEERKEYEKEPIEDDIKSFDRQRMSFS